MKKTRIILSATFLLIGISSTGISPVIARESVRLTEMRAERAERVQQRNVYQEEKQETIRAQQEEKSKEGMTLKKDNSIKEIDRRVTSLNKLIEKIKGMKRISETEKSKLTNQIQTEITSLNTLKTTIEADTDATALAEHKKSIVNSYRIYALFLPKITLIAHADQVIETADLMRAKTTDSDALAKIDSGKTKAQSAINEVIDLLPSGYPANKVTLENARKTLTSAIKDLSLARPMLNKKTK